MHSRQVNWFEVYSFAARWAARWCSSDEDLLGHDCVIPGSPQWCAMSDDDARKLLALIIGGIREALTHDVEQEHRADASRQISSAADWPAVSQHIRRRQDAIRSGAHIPRKATA